MWLSIPLENIAPRSSHSCGSPAVKTHDHREDFRVQHTTKCKAADKIEATFPEGIEGICKKYKTPKGDLKSTSNWQTVLHIQYYYLLHPF